MDKIAIIGCGWLGLPLGKKLSAGGAQVTGSTTRGEKIPQLQAAGISPFLFNTSESASYTRLKAVRDCGTLFLNIPPRRNSGDVENRYPGEIQKILDYLQESAIQHLVFASSTSVYASSETPISEDDDRTPAGASGRALRECEEMLLASQFPSTILRFAGLVGGDRHPGRFLARKEYMDNFDHPINIVHLDDCLAVSQLVIERRPIGEIFNVVCDEHPTRGKFYQAQAAKLGLEAPPNGTTNEGEYKVVSNGKLKATLGYEFQHPDPMKMMFSESD